MNKEQLKNKILKKFGKYSKFTTAAGIDRYAFQKDFLAKRDVSETDILHLESILTSLDDHMGKRVFTKAHAKLLTRAVNEFGGATRFAAENPDFKKVTVWQTMEGRKKLWTNGVTKLMKHFNLD